MPGDRLEVEIDYNKRHKSKSSRLTFDEAHSDALASDALRSSL
jgi:hypothetical protein